MATPTTATEIATTTATAIAIGNCKTRRELQDTAATMGRATALSPRCRRAVAALSPRCRRA
eukprot:10800813-Alexandrium_andersonii.AAC.1